MAEITLVAEAGRPTGSRASNRLRHAGRIPAVIYGHGTAPLPVSVDGRDLRAALTTDAGLNALLSLNVDGQTHLTLAREIQRHPVRNTVTHVDFQIVRRDEVVSADVPLVVVGEAHEVSVGNGVIEVPINSLTIHATPDAIPGSIEVDVTALVIGGTIRVGDLSLPEGVTTEIDADEPVVIARSAAAPVEEAPAEEAPAEAAGAEAEGTAGGPQPEGAAGGDGSAPSKGGGEG
jgi:large subunit ribosomal protein L25